MLDVMLAELRVQPLEEVPACVPVPTLGDDGRNARIVALAIVGETVVTDQHRILLVDLGEESLVFVELAAVGEMLLEPSQFERHRAADQDVGAARCCSVTELKQREGVAVALRPRCWGTPIGYREIPDGIDAGGPAAPVERRSAHHCDIRMAGDQLVLSTQFAGCPRVVPVQEGNKGSHA